MPDKDIEKEFEEAYNIAYAFWSPWLVQAKRDMEFFLSDQWDAAQKEYLREQRREALVFNKMHRVVKLISGYQRKNRLALRVDPTGNGDQATASQLSAVSQWNMTANDGYNILSDAFELGALVTGLNLVHLYVDYSDDMVSGDIRFERYPYARFLLDPNWSDRGLKKLRYLLTRDYLEKDDLLSILPEKSRSQLDGIRPGKDSKYPHFIPSRGISGDDLYAFDRMWVRGRKPYKILVDARTGQQVELPKGIPGDALRLIQAYMPNVKVINGYREQAELRIFVQGKLIWKGPDPSGVQSGLPFVPVAGLFVPEEPKAELRVQGVVRVMRDPQTETNKRRSKILDIIDSQISSGWEAFEDTIVNKESLYRSGQANVIWYKKGTDPTKMARKIAASEVPQGLFQVLELMDNDILEIPGANAELMGSPENDDIQVAGILAKLRQSQGLTVLQDLFDNLRLAQKHIGDRLVDMIQANYRPDKIQRITEKPATREFYTRTFGKYDAVCTEGVLTDSQRQMHYTQLWALKTAGAPIPWAAVISAAPIEKKDELMAWVQKEEQAQGKMQQLEAQVQQLQTLMAQAQIQSSLAGAAEKRTQAAENRTTAVLDRVKTIKELQGMDMQQISAAAQILKMLLLDPAMQIQQNQIAAQSAAQGPVGPVGNA